MKLPHRRATLAALLTGISGGLAGRLSSATPQRGGSTTSTTSGVGQTDAAGDVILPNGKLQRDEILKAEHDRNLKDAADLVDLAQQLEQDIEKNGTFIFSLATLKKTDDIEKLVKKIRSRMRHN